MLDFFICKLKNKYHKECFSKQRSVSKSNFRKITSSRLDPKKITLHFVFTIIANIFQLFLETFVTDPKAFRTKIRQSNPIFIERQKIHCAQQRIFGLI